MRFIHKYLMRSGCDVRITYLVQVLTYARQLRGGWTKKIKVELNRRCAGLPVGDARRKWLDDHKGDLPTIAHQVFDRNPTKSDHLLLSDMVRHRWLTHAEQ